MRQKVSSTRQQVFGECFDDARRPRLQFQVNKSVQPFAVKIPEFSWLGVLRLNSQHDRLVRNTSGQNCVVPGTLFFTLRRREIRASAAN